MDTNVVWHRKNRMEAIYVLCEDFQSDRDVVGCNLANLTARLDDFFFFGLKFGDLDYGDVNRYKRVLKAFVVVARKLANFADNQPRLESLLMWIKLHNKFTKCLKETSVKTYLESE